jgi:hypothetical protein
MSGPTTATAGGSATVSATFTGLVPGNKYLGAVFYTNGLNATVLRVDP